MGDLMLEYPLVQLYLVYIGVLVVISSYATTRQPKPNVPLRR
jgi:hypothetical protein